MPRQSERLLLKTLGKQPPQAMSESSDNEGDVTLREPSNPVLEMMKQQAEAIAALTAQLSSLTKMVEGERKERSELDQRVRNIQNPASTSASAVAVASASAATKRVSVGVTTQSELQTGTSSAGVQPTPPSGSTMLPPSATPSTMPMQPQFMSTPLTHIVPQPCVSSVNDHANNFGDLHSSSAQQHARVIERRHLHDLPMFSGRAEEWPMFLEDFRSTTAVFAYTQLENMIRLKKSLCGHARTAVECLLIHSRNVDQVIATLQLQFGRPEQLVRSQLQSVRNVQPIPETALELLIPFAAKVQNIATFLDTPSTQHHLCDPTLMEELADKLPLSRRFDWANRARAILPYPTLRDFSTFMNDVASLAGMLTPKTPQTTRIAGSSSRRSPVGNQGDRRPGKSTVCLIESPKSNPNNLFSRCKHCGEQHSIVTCAEFAKLSTNERWDAVKQRRLCFVCLGMGHNTSACRKKTTCQSKDCNSKRHHTLLHYDAADIRTMTVPTTSAAEQTESKKVMHVSHVARTQLLFRIVPVVLYGPSSEISTYAFFDEGSAVTLIDEQIANQLQLPGEYEQLNLEWFESGSTSRPTRSVNLRISAATPNADKHNLSSAKTVRNLKLPRQTVRFDQLHTRYQNLKHLPVAEYEDAKPMILIGQNNYHLCKPQTQYKHQGDPIASHTKLGWVIYGGQQHDFVGVCRTPSEIETLDDIQQIVKDYYTTENFGVRKYDKPLESNDVVRARALLEKTTRRVGERFETGLLWKSDDIVLPDSRDMAVKRLMGVEQKMRKDAAYAAMYEKNINTFMQKGYARKLTHEEAQTRTSRTWYLPHFGVANVNKPNRLRLVFDAAAAVGGVSLNTMLLTGPDQYVSLPDVLFKFRIGRVGVSADIQEMFLQVRIREADQQSQRFLWREDMSKPIDEYVMQVMTFGARCSPCSAQHVKNANALEHGAHDDVATQAIISNHYVDDFVMSFATPTDATNITRTVVETHRKGGFNLRNFRSNDNEVLRSLGCGVDNTIVDMQCEASCEKILGMHWDTADDTFFFKLNLHRIEQRVLKLECAPTKRQVLSATMSIFDPFGLLCNIMVYAKVLVQDLWRAGCGWDEQVPTKINEKWAQWLTELKRIDTCRVPRCYSQHMHSSSDIQLHVFADASEAAFVAVAFWRIVRADGQIDVSFIAGKTRCAPQKLLTIPRLELQAAVLAARLHNTIVASHDVRIDAVRMWTDSTTVLGWICSDQRLYKPFVAHRISEILDATEETQWRWVPTADNVADDATRTIYPPQFDPQSRWITGPMFLRKPESEWPQRTQPNETTPIDTEMRAHVNTCVIAEMEDAWVDISRFSSYQRLRRTVAWVLRYIHNARHSDKRSGELQPDEIDDAEHALFRIAQRQHFTHEYISLMHKRPIASSSKIYTLLPYLDETATMRMNGRTDAATFLPDDAKRPIILPRSHEITRLIVEHYHIKMKHQNQEAIVCELRQRFWIPQVRCVVKSVKSNCIACKLRNAKPIAPVMGQLPADRLTPFERPFTHTGIDYFGPFHVTIGRRREKRWVALFTCLTVRAIHLELAADLSTDACLLCIRNFVNLRGVPRCIRSDNGTNFVGASKVISDAIGNVDNDEITRELASRGVKWIFNSPSHPEAGGCWERMVRCVKRVLSVTLVETAPQVETLRSLLIDAANIVNSRPLTHIPVDASTQNPLTPNHFLLGYDNRTSDCADSAHFGHHKQWRIATTMKNTFWRRWVREYLPELTRRTKWHKEAPTILPGDLVLICDDSMSRSQFRRGRVRETFPGPDGRTRNATVTTNDGLLRRPISRLAKLDIV